MNEEVVELQDQICDILTSVKNAIGNLGSAESCETSEDFEAGLDEAYGDLQNALQDLKEIRTQFKKLKVKK